LALRVTFRSVSFFKTIRSIAAGVFAVASLMVGGVRLRLLPETPGIEISNSSTIETLPRLLPAEITPMILTSSLTLLVGMIQVSNTYRITSLSIQINSLISV
jgi:hypothetical protein